MKTTTIRTTKQVMMVFCIAILGCLVFTVYAAMLFFRYKSRETGVFLALGAGKRSLAGQLFRGGGDPCGHDPCHDKTCNEYEAVAIDGGLQDHAAYGDQDVLQGQGKAQLCLPGGNGPPVEPVLLLKLHDTMMKSHPSLVKSSLNLTGTLDLMKSLSALRSAEST